LATKLKHVVRGNNLQKILESLSHIYTGNLSFLNRPLFFAKNAVYILIFIFLVARNQQNQNSAKTSLKLIVTTVLQRVDKNENKNDQSQLQVISCAFSCLT